MVLRVLDALGESEHIGARLLCGPPRHAMEQCPELQAGIDHGYWNWVENQATPSSSAAPVYPVGIRSRVGTSASCKKP